MNPFPGITQSPLPSGCMFEVMSSAHPSAAFAWFVESCLVQRSRFLRQIFEGAQFFCSLSSTLLICFSSLPLPCRLICRLFDRIPRITLDTIFLDQDLRVSRLPDRNFLIYVKDY